MCQTCFLSYNGQHYLHIHRHISRLIITILYKGLHNLITLKILIIIQQDLNILFTLIYQQPVKLSRIGTLYIPISTIEADTINSFFHYFFTIT